MTPMLLVFAVSVGILLLVLIWVTRRPSRRSVTRYNPASLEDTGRRHVIYFRRSGRPFLQKTLSFSPR
jgi:hypothetical protein